MLNVRNLGVRYGRRAALQDVCLRCAPGEITAVLGANGSGKSTLLRAAAGLVRHTGTITGADGRPPLRACIGYMPQDTNAQAALSVFEVVLLGRLRSLTLRVAKADLTAAEQALTELRIADLAWRRIGELSGGQRQLAFLAQVLAGDPRILLLDEPTSALDIAHQLEVLALLRDATRRRGLTTVAVMHDLNAAARHADHVVLLAAGRLAGAGAPGTVLTQGALRAAFGAEVAVVDGPDGRPVVVPLSLA
ncbi:MAG: ABC transporter ATP-binding protein, partial [Acetobacteraceae bacterium]